jgi:predicted ABC-type ATPase
MSKPIVLFFAGPNGSGKSSLTKYIPHYGVYINTDDLKKEYDLTDLEAAQKAEALRNECVEKMIDFTFETVLSTERNLLLLRKAKEKGYFIQCFYVLTCNPDINVTRVKARVHAGGHDVPEDKIRKRYVKALNLLPQIIDICDKILIYDNSTDEQFLVFSKAEYNFPSEIWPTKKVNELLKHMNISPVQTVKDLAEQYNTIAEYFRLPLVPKPFSREPGNEL